MINELFEAALQHHRAKRFEQAEKLCKDILNSEPAHIEALYLMGVFNFEIGNYDDAKTYMEQVIQLNPGSVKAYNQLDHIFREKGLINEAIDNYQRALQHNPENAELYFGLGNAFIRGNLIEQAFRCYSQTLSLNPDHRGALNNTGNIFKDRGILDQARHYYELALKIKPDDRDAHNNLGNVYSEMGELDRASECYEKAIAIDPQFAEACNNIGNTFKDKKQPDLAAHWYHKALRLNPKLAQTHYNLGIVLQIQGKGDEAIASYQRAIKINPSYAEAHLNLGGAYQERRFIEAAEACYKKAIACLPEFAEARWNAALILLLKGKLKEGWQGLEWRNRIKNISVYRTYTQPMWDGSDVAGKTVLLFAEQGFGDAIQYVRYAPLIARQGANVILECQKELIPLFQGVEGVQGIVSRGTEALPEFDVHCPLLSLPRVFGTVLETIPAEVPYIKADPLLVKQWSERLKADYSPWKIGLVWDGIHPRQKSIPLSQWLPLGGLSEVTFYSLQKGAAAEQANHLPAGMGLVDYTEELHNFADTAALIENMDLVISVDTAVAHLAGAMGKRVWTLLLYSPDWRWLLEGDTSLWYPTMRLFRQASFGLWGPVIKRIREELEMLIVAGD